MTENHTHRHSDPANVKTSTLWICLAINIAFVVTEALIGWQSNSTGLLSDAGHNLSDALGLMLSLIATYMLASDKSSNRTISRYLTTANAGLLLIAVFLIAWESIGKIIRPEAVDASAVMLTALIGIVINGLTAWLLMRGQKGDLNMKAAFLHAATDTLVSVGVVISGAAIHFTGYDLIDPLVSLCITLIIAVPTVKLLVSSLKTKNFSGRIRE